MATEKKQRHDKRKKILQSQLARYRGRALDLFGSMGEKYCKCETRRRDFRISVEATGKHFKNGLGA